MVGSAPFPMSPKNGFRPTVADVRGELKMY